MFYFIIFVIILIDININNGEGLMKAIEWLKNLSILKRISLAIITVVGLIAGLLVNTYGERVVNYFDNLCEIEVIAIDDLVDVYSYGYTDAYFKTEEDSVVFIQETKIPTPYIKIESSKNKCVADALVTSYTKNYELDVHVKDNEFNKLGFPYSENKGVGFTERNLVTYSDNDERMVIESVVNEMDRGGTAALNLYEEENIANSKEWCKEKECYVGIYNTAYDSEIYYESPITTFAYNVLEIQLNNRDDKYRKYVVFHINNTETKYSRVFVENIMTYNSSTLLSIIEEVQEDIDTHELCGNTIQNVLTNSYYNYCNFFYDSDMKEGVLLSNYLNENHSGDFEINSEYYSEYNNTLLERIEE